MDGESVLCLCGMWLIVFSSVVAAMIHNYEGWLLADGIYIKNERGKHIVLHLYYFNLKYG